MKPRFSPALCVWLEGMGFDINITTKTHNSKMITIEILNIPDHDTTKEYIKEMKKLSIEVCTNG